MKGSLKYIFITFFIIGLCFFVLPEESFAQLGPLAPGSPGSLAPAQTGAIPTGGLITGFLDATIGGMVSSLLYLVTVFISVLLGISGLLLDYVVRLSIIDMAKNIASITGINIAWTVIRNLVNISFIFILVYQGIMTIFGKGDAKKAIVGIVTAALLVNFSLLFTKAIIDASNIVAVTFYNSISTSGNNVNLVGGTGNSGAISLGFSGAFMKPLGLTSFWNGESLQALEGSSNTKLIQVYIFASLFFLITTFVFLAMSVLFVIRYLAFILLLIISPVGFLFGLIPKAKKYADQYWQTLFGQAIFAPLYFLMTWIILTIMSSPGFLGPGMTVTSFDIAIATPGPGNIGLIVNFVLIIGLTIASLVISKQYATQGGIVSSNMVNTGTAMLGGALFGGAAWASRTTIGRAGNAISESERLKDRATAGGATGWLANQALLRGSQASKSTFDARNTKVAGEIDKKLGIDMGKGLPWRADAGKGGYQGRLEAKVKEKTEKEVARAELLKPTDLQAEQAKKALKDDANKARWEAERDAHFATGGAYQSSPEYAKLQTDITTSKAKLTVPRNELANSKNDVERQKKLIKAQDKKIEEMMEKIADPTKHGLTPIQVTTMQNQLMIVEEPLRKSMQQQMQTFEDLVEEKKDKYLELKKEYDKLNNQEEADKNKWLTEEQKKLIETTGGRAEEKDRHGNIKQDVVESRDVQYLDQRSEKYTSGKRGFMESGFLGDKHVFTKNKEVARNLRKAGRRNKK